MYGTVFFSCKIIVLFIIAKMVRERIIAKMVRVSSPYPYMVKTFKNLLQNRRCLGLNICTNHQGDGRSIIAKMIIIRWHLIFFTASSSLLPYAFVWAPYICMGKMLRLLNDFFSEAAGPLLLKFHMEPPWGGVMKDC